MTITLGPKCVGPQGRTNVGLEALNFSSNVWLILKCVSQDISCIQRPQERIQATTHKKEPQRAQWGVHRLLSKDNRWADRSVGTACPSARLSCKCLLTAHCCILCGYTEILNFSLRLFGKFPFPLSNAPFPASLYWVLTSRMNSTPFSSVQLLSHVRLHEPQHARPPCPSPSPRVHPNPCPLSRWCHPTISSSVDPLSSCPQSFPVFSNDSALRIRWPKYWSFSFNISPSNEHPGLISFRMDWLDLLAVQELSRVYILFNYMDVMIASWKYLGCSNFL